MTEEVDPGDAGCGCLLLAAMAILALAFLAVFVVCWGMVRWAWS